MGRIEDTFAQHFSNWDITIPPGHVRDRKRGKIVAYGWAIWYLYGSDGGGEYLDYYACHRMTGDRHSRIREDGSEEHLPTIVSMCLRSQDPEEDARLKARFLAENRRVARMLEEKGFGMEGNEPGGVQVNRYLVLGLDEDPDTAGGRA